MIEIVAIKLKSQEAMRPGVWPGATPLLHAVERAVRRV
jgi:hypothetical protein